MVGMFRGYLITNRPTELSRANRLGWEVETFAGGARAPKWLGKIWVAAPHENRVSGG